MDRRSFLTRVGAAGAVSAATLFLGNGSRLWLPSGFTPAGADPSTWPSARGADGNPYVVVAEFPCGVASGDPGPGSITLWTRVDPGLDTGAGVTVDVEIATTPEFGSSTVATASVPTDASRDHTVHADLTGLPVGSVLWYRFTAGGATSPLGRTKTAPAPDDDRPVRLAAFSCQRYTHGYYNVHRHLAGMAADPATDLDVVVSLGDYVYDTGAADGVEVAGRVDPIQNASSLDDFRAKYQLYRSDPYLQAMHAAFPVVAIFDNHDGMSSPTDPQGPGAVGAYWEYQPVGPQSRGALTQYRRLSWGSMLDLFLTDQRSFRDPTVRASGSSLGLSSLEYPEMLDPGRTMLGSTQRQWLVDGLVSSTTTWRTVGSQLMFWPWRVQAFPDQRDPADPLRRNPGRYLNMIQWDGYQGDRQVILDALATNGVQNTLVLSGDSHVWSAAQIAPDWDDPEARPVVVEFGPSSVTSANAREQSRYPSTSVVLPLLKNANPNTMTFFKAEDHGVGIVELTSTRALVTFLEAETITTPGAGLTVLTSFEVPAGTQTLTDGPVQASSGGAAAPAATATPRFTG